ncbi:MAG: hypothetical protein PHD83_05285 [Caldisericia bacterium]|nr:hypothetical protein [Caldisericia bacterium]
MRKICGSDTEKIYIVSGRGSVFTENTPDSLLFIMSLVTNTWGYLLPEWMTGFTKKVINAWSESIDTIISRSEDVRIIGKVLLKMAFV